MSKFKPFVFWGQDRDNVFIKVDVAEIQNKPKVCITDDSMVFEGEGVGVCGRNIYAFSINFYLPVVAKECRHKNTGRCLQVVLKKEGNEKWPRLVESTDRISWIRIDFDRFAFDTSDESAQEEDNNISKMNYDDLLNDPKRSKTVNFTDDDFKMPDYKTSYLFLYNLFQFVGYSYILVAIILRNIRDGLESRATTFESVGPQMIFCQLVAYFEIVHALCGWVKTNVITTFIQVIGRSYILFVLVAMEPRMQEKEVLWGLFIAWSAIEVIRYPYYILATLGKKFSLLTWLRYTVWIPLYPLGFLFEGLVMIVALPIFEQSGKYDIKLPNNFNFSFQFVLFMKIYMIAMLPGMYVLMQRMYQQRKKKLQTVDKSRYAKKYQ